jgi:hypothetical protein
MSEQVMLKDLPSSSSVVNSDEFVVWNGSNNARRVNRSAIVKEEHDTINSIESATASATGLTIGANSGATLQIPYTPASGKQVIAIMNVVTSFPGLRIENYWYDPSTNIVNIYVTNTLSESQSVRLVAFMLIRKTMT